MAAVGCMRVLADRIVFSNCSGAFRPIRIDLPTLHLATLDHRWLAAMVPLTSVTAPGDKGWVMTPNFLA